MAFYPLRVNLVNAQASFANYFEYYTYERLHASIDYRTSYHTHQKLLQLSSLNCSA